MRFSNILFVLLLTSLLLISDKACTQNDPSRYGGELRYGELGSPSTLNPYSGAAASGIQDRLFVMIYEGLVRYDYDHNKVIYVLADTSEISNKNRRITFKLKENITWHDGEKFTAEDVKFTFSYIKNKAREHEKRKFSFIRSINVLDEYTVEFNFRKSYPEILILFNTWIIPKHRFNEDLSAFSGRQALGRRPIGTGPYKFQEKTQEGNVTLLVNKLYWGGRACIEKVKMICFLDPSIMVRSLTYGLIDLVVDTPLEAVTRLKNMNRFRIEPYNSFSFHAFGYNNNNPALKNFQVRKALTQAVARDSLLLQWYAGRGSTIHGPFSSRCPHHNPELVPFDYDPATARQLLESAGFKDSDGDGVLENINDGTKLEFDLVIPINQNAGTTIQNVTESYVNYLKRVGVKINVINSSKDDYINMLFYFHDYDIGWIEWEFDPSYDITNLFYSTKNYPGGSNFINYNNKEIDFKFDEFRNAKDWYLRREIIFEVQEILREECPYTFLFNVDNYATMNRNLTRVEIDGYYFFTHLKNWFFSND